MSDYTLYPDGDKKQVSGSAITASSTIVDGGTVFALGTAVPSGSVITAQVQLGNRLSVHGSQIVQSKFLFGAFQGSSVSLTSVANAAGAYAGFCDFTKSSHGLSVGTVINVTGSTSGNVDGPQKIIAVPDANSIVTDKAYTASATAGSYTLVAGNFATMTAEQYIMLGHTSSIAGGQKTNTGFGADHGIRRAIHKLEAMRTRRVATAIRSGYWNVYSGQFSTDPTSANDISSFGTDHAATPTKLVPGELVYRHSGQPDGTLGPVQDDYKAKTA